MTESKPFPRACVASPHYLASAAGLAVLADGGNALDAAIATNLVLGVVSPYMCGYGGDLFAMIYSDERSSSDARGGRGAQRPRSIGLHAYNGSGRAPAGATVETVRAAVEADELPERGPLTVTVPGAVEGWFVLLDRFGTRPFAELAAQALAYTRDGFVLTSRGAGYIQAHSEVFAEPWASEWHDVYDAASAGSLFRQPGLAATIELLCAEGPDAYYRGPIADAIAATLGSHGAFMSTDDLAAHSGDWVEPLSTSYRGTEIYEMPPNSQGVVALEALNIVEGIDVGEAGGAHRQHVLIEATKLALSDRVAYVTDPDHMRIDPRELASKSWATTRRSEIDLDQACAPAPGRAAVGGTIYLCAADADGMLVSLIQSNYAGFGSGVTVPEWGINLQNRGTFFSLDAGDANVIAPRKRTMHTLMPAMAFRGEKPWLVFGTMGGDGQAQTHVQFLSRVIDDDRDIQDAIDRPRWRVSLTDWRVLAESAFARAVTDGLEARGHNVEVVDPGPGFGHAHAIRVTDHGYAAAFDPRSEGAALGF